MASSFSTTRMVSSSGIPIGMLGHHKYLFRIGCFYHAVAVFLKDATSQAADGVIVLHHQDGLVLWNSDRNAWPPQMPLPHWLLLSRGSRVLEGRYKPGRGWRHRSPPPGWSRPLELPWEAAARQSHWPPLPQGKKKWGR